MQSQKFDEKSERNEEIDSDWKKAENFPESIIGRKRLRMMRRILGELGISMPIPMNHASFTDEYCKKYGKKEEAGDWPLFRRKDD